MGSLRPSLFLCSALALLGACGEGSVQFVQLPEHGALSTVLAFRADADAPFTLHVFGTPAASSDAIREDNEVFALHYAEAPADLGLEVGGVRRCLLLRPRFVDRLEGERFEAYVGPLPAELQRALVENPERCSPCRTVDMKSVSYPEVGTLKAGTWLDSGQVVSSSHGGFRRVDRERSELVAGCELSRPAAKFTSLARVGPNRYWAGGELGELMRIRFDDAATTCTVETSTVIPHQTPQPPVVQHLSLDPFDPDPATVYALLADGRLLRYERGKLEALGALELHPFDVGEGGTSIGRLLFVEAGRGLATAGWNRIAWWGPGGIERVDEIQLPINQFIRDGGQRITALAYDAREERLLAGAAQGLVLSHDPTTNGWVPTLQLPIRKEVRAFEDFGDRWLLVIEQGDLVVWHRETGLCPEPIRMPLAINSGRCAYHARRGPSLAVFDALGDNNRPMGVVWIEEE